MRPQQNGYARVRLFGCARILRLSQQRDDLFAPRNAGGQQVIGNAHLVAKHTPQVQPALQFRVAVLQRDLLACGERFHRPPGERIKNKAEGLLVHHQAFFGVPVERALHLVSHSDMDEAKLIRLGKIIGHELFTAAVRHQHRADRHFCFFQPVRKVMRQSPGLQHDRAGVLARV